MKGKYIKKEEKMLQERGLLSFGNTQQGEQEIIITFSPQILIATGKTDGIKGNYINKKAGNITRIEDHYFLIIQ